MSCSTSVPAPPQAQITLNGQGFMSTDAPSFSDYQTVFTNAKAGMEGLTDKEKDHIKKASNLLEKLL